jgi:hypothetical protein
MSETDPLIVNKETDTSYSFNYKEYGSIGVIAVLIIIVAVVAYYKDPECFTSADGVVARRSQNQSRSDPEVDREFNLKELERSVALLNRDMGAL